jgi:hypothetical protein
MSGKATTMRSMPPAESPSRWRSAPLEEDQADLVRTLFAECFDKPLSQALWQWKYAHGHGLASGVWNQDGELVAHYGGFPRIVSDAGQARMAVQIGDVMVRPDVRGVMTKKGAFYQAVTHFLSAHVGDGAAFPHAFGFPNRRTMALGQRLGLYQPVGSVAELVWEVPPTVALPWLRQLEPVTSVREAEVVAPLWHAMLRDFPDELIGVRDAARIAQRYLTHPEHDYGVWLLRHRLTRRAIGLVVVRQHDDRLDWLDLVAPTAAWDECAQVVVFLARRQGLNRVTLWLTRPFDQHLHLPHQLNDPDIVIPCNSYTPGPSAESIRDRWLLMGGDTDFL